MIFMIFSFGVVILHMVWGVNHDCSSIDENGKTISGPWSCPTRDTDFPRDPYSASMASFFMMVSNDRAEVDHESLLLFVPTIMEFCVILMSLYILPTL